MTAVKVLDVDSLIESQLIFVFLLVRAGLDSKGRPCSLRNAVYFMRISGHIAIIEVLSRVRRPFHGLSVQGIAIFLSFVPQVVLFAGFFEETLT